MSQAMVIDLKDQNWNPARFLFCWDNPLHWRKPRRVYVAELFDGAEDAMLDRIFAVMALCPQHTFQVLTKRPERMLEYVNNPCTPERIVGRLQRWLHDGVIFKRNAYVKAELYAAAAIQRIDRWPLVNVWLGVSVEDQKTADERIPLLLQTPAAVRFISAKPLLGPVEISSHRIPQLWTTKLDWVICGGESGPGARPMHPDWARGLRDQCVAAGVPFFFKRNGEWASVSEVAGSGPHHHFPDGSTVRRVGKKAAGDLLDGKQWHQFPEKARGQHE